MKHLVQTIFLLLFLVCCGWAQSGPHAGTFNYIDSSGEAMKEYTVTLTPTKSGDFAVSGSYIMGRNKPQKITGILHRKTGHLNVTVHDESGHLMDQSFPLKGYWSAKDHTLVLQGTHNMVTKLLSADDWVCDGPTIEDKGTGHRARNGWHHHRDLHA